MGVLGASWPLNNPGHTLCLTCSTQKMCAKVGGGQGHAELRLELKTTTQSVAETARVRERFWDVH